MCDVTKPKREGRARARVNGSHCQSDGGDGVRWGFQVAPRAYALKSAAAGGNSSRFNPFALQI